MKNFIFILFPLILLVFASQTHANLRKQERALLRFAARVPRIKKLNWTSAAPVCFSWVGIKCNFDNKSVISIRLPGFGLSGSIPKKTLGKLTSLVFLSLRSNFLTGTLPSDLLSLPSLQYVHLQRNSFSGKIPESLSPQLNTIDLSFNLFEGEIPSSTQNLTSLEKFYLQNNSLTGLIDVLNVTSLKRLNVSNNQFNGSIPSTLKGFPSSSFLGNDGLCGPPLKQCPGIISPSPSLSPSQSLSPSPSPVFSPFPSPSLSPPEPVSPLPSEKEASRKSLSMGGIIGIVLGSVLLLLLLVIIFFRCLKKKDSKRTIVHKTKAFNAKNHKEEFGSAVKNKLVFLEGSAFNFDLEDLLRASAEVMGKGSYGTTYKAVLEDGTTVVVKRLKDVVVGKREFEQQMELIARVGGHHSNVVPLGAYYYSKDEKLLVYEFVTAGSLSARLHGGREKPALNWESRARILLGAAKGVEYIHSSSVGDKITHGNIKSSNVLLSDDLTGCISDFGLPPLMSIPSIPPRTTGYRAPETNETCKLTQKSDVYSFGVLILEVLTGKTPGHNEVIDLPKWVKSVVREEWTAEVFDVELTRQENIIEELVQMLQVGMACVSKVPDLRPDMGEVVKIIEEIRLYSKSEGVKSKMI